jgi:hypothetical protein
MDNMTYSSLLEELQLFEEVNIYYLGVCEVFWAY